MRRGRADANGDVRALKEHLRDWHGVEGVRLAGMSLRALRRLHRELEPSCSLPLHPMRSTQRG